MSGFKRLRATSIDIKDIDSANVVTKGRLYVTLKKNNILFGLISFLGIISIFVIFCGIHKVWSVVIGGFVIAGLKTWEILPLYLNADNYITIDEEGITYNNNKTFWKEIARITSDTNYAGSSTVVMQNNSLNLLLVSGKKIYIDLNRNFLNTSADVIFFIY